MGKGSLWYYGKMNACKGCSLGVLFVVGIIGINSDTRQGSLEPTLAM